MQQNNTQIEKSRLIRNKPASHLCNRALQRFAWPLYRPHVLVLTFSTRCQACVRLGNACKMLYFVGQLRAYCVTQVGFAKTSKLGLQASESASNGPIASQVDTHAQTGRQTDRQASWTGRNIKGRQADSNQCSSCQVDGPQRATRWVLRDLSLSSFAWEQSDGTIHPVSPV